MVAAAVAALAVPVIDTAARRAEHAKRQARAVVIGEGFDPQSVAGEAAGAFAYATFSRARLADGLSDAVRWLGAQPPASREIVIAATFRRGQLHQSDIDRVPADIGIRLKEQVREQQPLDAVFPVIVLRDGRPARVMRRVRVDEASTTVGEDAGVAMPTLPIQIVADPADQALADAALRAALTAGVRWPDHTSMRQLVLVWPSTPEAAVQQLPAGATVVRLSPPTQSSEAASLVARAIAEAVAAPTGALEPYAIAAQELGRWTRPPGPPPAASTPVDEGDRRWLWAVALALIGVEHLLRRTPRPEVAGAAPDSTQEARVA